MASVTVVVPVYNMESLVARCFDSILAQTCPDWEAILVDDGSTDGSGRVCDEYAQKDSRFRVLHKANGGVCSARNAGLEAVRTPYAVLMDQDDMLSPVALEAALKAQATHPGCLITFCHTEDKNQLQKTLPSAAEERFYASRQVGHLYNHTPLVPPWCKLYPMDFLRRHALRFDETQKDGYEDRPFLREYLAAFWKENPEGLVCNLACPYYFWERENEASVSRRPDKPLKQAHFDMFDGLLRDAVELYHAPLLSLQYIMLEYIQTIAFGLSCLPEARRQPALEEFARLDAYRRMVEYFPKARFYSVFYGPFRRRQAGLIARLSQGRLENDAFYWRLYKLGRLLHPSWQDWKGIDAIPAD